MDDLTSRIVALEAAVLGLATMELGDVSGHPFHGNQWTEGTSVLVDSRPHDNTPQRGTVVKATHDEDGNKIRAGHVAVQVENGQGTWGFHPSKVSRDDAAVQRRDRELMGSATPKGIAGMPKGNIKKLSDEGLKTAYTSVANRWRSTTFGSSLSYSAAKINALENRRGWIEADAERRGIELPPWTGHMPGPGFQD